MCSCRAGKQQPKPKAPPAPTSEDDDDDASEEAEEELPGGSGSEGGEGADEGPSGDGSGQAAEAGDGVPQAVAKRPKVSSHAYEGPAGGKLQPHLHLHLLLFAAWSTVPGMLIVAWARPCHDAMHAFPTCSGFAPSPCHLHPLYVSHACHRRRS